MHFSFFKYCLKLQGLFLGFSALLMSPDAYCGKRKAQALENVKEEKGKEKINTPNKMPRLVSPPLRDAEEFTPYNEGVYSNLMKKWKEGEKQDHELIDTLQSLADNGYAPAQHRLGKLYAKGKAALRNWNNGVELLEKATQQGYPAAYTCLGQALWNGRFDPQETLSLYEIAATRGHVRANYKIGQMYANGDFDADRTEDVSQALVWYWMGRSYPPALEKFKEYITLKPKILREAGEFSELVDPLFTTIEPLIARYKVEIARNEEGYSPFSHKKLFHKHTYIYDYLESTKSVLVRLKDVTPGFMVSAAQFNQVPDSDIENADGMSVYYMAKRGEKKKPLLTVGKENASIQEGLQFYLDDVERFNVVLKDFDKLISFHQAPLKDQRRKITLATVQGQLLEDKLGADQDLRSKYDQLSITIAREKEALKKIKEEFKPKIRLLTKEKNQLEVIFHEIKYLIRGEGLKRRNDAFLKELGE